MKNSLILSFLISNYETFSRLTRFRKWMFIPTYFVTVKIGNILDLSLIWFENFVEFVRQVVKFVAKVEPSRDSLDIFQKLDVLSI